MFFPSTRRTVPSTETPIRPESFGARARRAYRAFNLRRVPGAAIYGAGLTEAACPCPGDLVLARIESIGHHTRLQLASGRRVSLSPGDELLVAYGDRYATAQFEAEVPADLSACHLVAAGGIAGRVVSRCSSVRAATRITPVGLLTGPDGATLNLADFALDVRVDPPQPGPITIAVLGTTMDAGKTTTVASLVRGLRATGLSVHAVKATGTGACGDYYAMIDAGAGCVLDMVDAGLVTTYKASENAVERCFATLLSHASDGADVVVVEIADGLLQSETARLIRSNVFKRSIDSVVLACGDALGAVAARQIIEAEGLPLAGIAGRVTASELGAREAREATQVPVLSLSDLRHPEIINLVAPRVGGVR